MCGAADRPAAHGSTPARTCSKAFRRSSTRPQLSAADSEVIGTEPVSLICAGLLLSSARPAAKTPVYSVDQAIATFTAYAQQRPDPKALVSAAFQCYVQQTILWANQQRLVAESHHKRANRLSQGRSIIEDLLLRMRTICTRQARCFVCPEQQPRAVSSPCLMQRHHVAAHRATPSRQFRVSCAPSGHHRVAVATRSKRVVWTRSPTAARLESRHSLTCGRHPQ